ncbi:MAG: hypothetical protein ABIR91_00835, partial [Candidatus Saccharimonadales bacterium]
DSRPRAAWSSSITSYAVEYTVVKIELNTSVPHMFIDGLQRNPFRAHNRDLWSLSKRLSRADRVRALEGDFYKFFDVYIADKDAIAALSILTPDVMIQLRDNGYEFDYELYDSAVYIIGPSHRRRAVASIVRQDIDALQQAIEVCMTQLIPQVTGKNFLTDKVLRVTNTNELLFGWLFSVLLIVRWLWIITLYCAVALVIAVVLLLMT